MSYRVNKKKKKKSSMKEQGARRKGKWDVWRP